ncbi:hypothetical protein EF83_13280 [Bacillus subtilis]|nr:hypothetical protein EF83_13280 [Bacillus subtilis]
MNTAYRVWDGEQMYYYGDEGICLSIGELGSIDGKVFGWSLWLEGYGVIAHSGDGKSVLMWHIGLLDKNNKAIYQNDFFEFANGEKGVVEWIEDKAMYDVRNYYDPRADYPNIAFSEHAHCLGEVKGNICENSELLEGAE